jgi:hypothetical protein
MMGVDFTILHLTGNPVFHLTLPQASTADRPEKILSHPWNLL